ncbi:response regulator transcription factor [Psychrobium sp. 1_MG-2023]|uniref:response regulator transcription factor n=1 Tax=Psychrobium sp. 1_MG-2023 TaxID=3062624 RepID=UPI000C34CB84|nr:response regulator transcription factor [Psychrobium sp. 1_MG-2023]MDP2561714.1 response regulator transcription factor [Psychrobium sp. 1_MG-2023]PKF57114.1 DNA-binding response regulator [Alteromonadales bacterium alter-6D02]
MGQRILVVEDENDLANLIELTLNNAGFIVDQCNCGQQGLERALTTDYALIILDIMLPNVDGLEICRQVRINDPVTPIMMLTARNTETDRVMGLEMGADDYLTKPFSIRELEARVKALLRRAAVGQTAEEFGQKTDLVFGDFVIDPRCHEVIFNGSKIELTSTEFELLYFLAQHPNQVFNRSQLLDSVWGYNHVGYEHTVNSHINRLRAKLEQQPKLPKLVHTIWGVGYKFEFSHS